MLRKNPFITGECYHIYNRGIDKRVIFKSQFDYERFLMLLYIANTTKSFRLDQLINYQHKVFKDIFSIDRGELLVSIGGWCLMNNHFHLLLKQEVDGGITKFMKKLGTGYSMYFNIKYNRRGALFGGLFKSKLIEDDDYMKHLLGYVHLNPLEIKFPNWEKSIGKNNREMKNFLESYVYSSYTDYLHKKREVSAILSTKAFPKYFNDTKDFSDFIESYFTDFEQEN